jgi:hypothetical protein
MPEDSVVQSVKTGKEKKKTNWQLFLQQSHSAVSKGKTKTFLDNREFVAEQIDLLRKTKGFSLGQKKTTPNGNLNPHKVMKSTGEVKWAGKHKRVGRYRYGSL